MKSRAHHASVARDSMSEAANSSISDSAKVAGRWIHIAPRSTLFDTKAEQLPQIARLTLPPLRQIFLGQRRSGRLGLHHDARNSPAAGFFDRLNAVDAARDLLAVAVQRVAAP
jgi:hypothetical protein